MEVLVVVAVVAITAWYFWLRPKKAAQNDAAQSWVEHRMLDLLKEDPHAPDELIATLVRDEITNRRLRDPELFAWATAATVARLKRTAIRLMMENQLNPNERKPNEPKSLKPKPENIKCESCGTKNRPSRTRCRSCDDPLRA